MIGCDFNPRSPCGERPRLQWRAGRRSIFQSTLPVRGATRRPVRRFPQMGFQSTLPVRGATDNVRRAFASGRDFNPRSPCGERRPMYDQQSHRSHFNPRSPCGERPRIASTKPKTSYFNPRSPCGERLDFTDMISPFADFNPRSPCGERHYWKQNRFCAAKFQSTLPVRGATTALGYSNRLSFYFNPRSPCGERPPTNPDLAEINQFQSTLPVRGATGISHKSY